MMHQHIASQVSSILIAIFVISTSWKVNTIQGVTAISRNNPPLIFTNNASFRRRPSSNFNSRSLTNTQLASSSSSSSSTYNEYDYEDGDNEWDRLERIKKELEQKLGGYRPWSIDTSSGQPGQYSWTSKILFLNVIVYGLQMVNPNITKMFLKRSDMIRNGKQLYRVFTPMFLHGSVSHLMLNSFSMNNIGPEMERLFGSGRFLMTYAIGGIAGNIASAYYTPNPSLGASGAVFGLMGAYYAFLSRNEEIFGRSGKATMGRIASTLGMNVMFGFMMPSIDNWAHIGGAIGGVAMATSFGPKLSFMGLPSGGRIIVDKPAVRLPPSIESIPGTISKRLRRGGKMRRMRGQRYQSELPPANPWRRNRNAYRNGKWERRRKREGRRHGGTFELDRKPLYD